MKTKNIQPSLRPCRFIIGGDSPVFDGFLVEPQEGDFAHVVVSAETMSAIGKFMTEDGDLWEMPELLERGLYDLWDYSATLVD